MNERDQNTPAVDSDLQQTSTQAVNAGRRKIATGGVAGAGVLLSVTSRSAFGTSVWGTCTGSEIASGNLSNAGTPRPCGCSPGYWKSSNQNGSALWDNVSIFSPYLKSAKFNTVFGCAFYASGNVTLQQAVDQTTSALGSWCPSNKVSAMRNVAFHAVAALLNAQFYGDRFPFSDMQTATGVITVFRNAFTSGTAALTTQFSDRFKSFYSSYPNLWCNGSQESPIQV